MSELDWLDDNEEKEQNNTLMILLKNGSYFQYETMQNNVNYAFYKFCTALETVGIDDSNVKYDSAVLRDENGKEIGRISL